MKSGKWAPRRLIMSVTDESGRVIRVTLGTNVIHGLIINPLIRGSALPLLGGNSILVCLDSSPT